MLLRLLMVGAVASLGLDLPSGPDLDGWLGSTQAWLDQTWSCWSVPSDELTSLDEDEPAEAPADAGRASVPSGVSEATETTVQLTATDATDRNFQDIVSELAATFALPPEAEAAPPAPADAPATPTLSWEPADVGDDLYPGLAFELNRLNEGVPAPEDPPAEAFAEEATTTAPPSAEERLVCSRGERLAVAVRLTEQALRAWVNLLHQGPSIISARE